MYVLPPTLTEYWLGERLQGAVEAGLYRLDEMECQSTPISLAPYQNVNRTRMQAAYCTENSDPEVHRVEDKLAHRDHDAIDQRPTKLSADEEQ